MSKFILQFLTVNVAFDPEWNTNGLQEKAVDLFVSWVKSQNVEGLKMEVLFFSKLLGLDFEGPMVANVSSFRYCRC